MTMVIPAFMYIILACSFVILMYMQEITLSAEMYEATVARFEQSPWQLNPTKTIRQVRGSGQVYQWLSNVFINQLYIEAEYGWGNQSNVNASLMVGSYNMLLGGRLTLKRKKLNRPTDHLFANSVARSMSYAKTNAWGQSSSEELTSDFGSSLKFKYEKDKGFNDAGGYVQMLDFSLPKKDLMQQVSNLKDNFWFDLSQGSLAVELLYFNGNIDRFLYVVFIFEHDFTGQTDVTVKVCPLSMTIHEPTQFTAWVRYILYLVILIFVMVFIKNETEDMTADYQAYFSQPMGFVNVCSFFLITCTMISFFLMVFNFTFLNFRLPMDPDPQKRIEQFSNIAQLARTNEFFGVLLGISTCFVVVQAVALMTNLLSQWRLVSTSLTSMDRHLVAFLVIFFIMITGFGLSGHFLLGLDMDEFSSPPRSLLTVMEMIKGLANYKHIVQTGGFFGDCYWFSLEFFFLIYGQLLTAIISVGYFKQRDTQSNDAAQPLQRFIKSVKHGLRKYSAGALRLLSPITSLLSFGRSSGPPQEDFDQVARLRDKRATKAVVRTVRYELRHGELESDLMDDLASDVTLRAKEPFYPDGMVHYYVEETKPDGPARDFKVSKGFRLVGIREEGVWDYKHFRDKDRFHEIYKGNPQGVLKGLNMPVQLLFQGRVRLFSLECVALLFFCGVFLAFGLQVARVGDTYAMTSLQRSSMEGGQWLDTELSRVMSFQNVSMQEKRSFSTWTTEVFLRHQMSCRTIPGGRSCLPNEGTRDNWSLWVSDPNLERKNLSDIISSAGGQPGLRLFQGSRPPSAVGLSIGFVPDGQPSRIDRLLSQSRGKNAGVMRNNYARMTFQLACFKQNANDRFKVGYPYVIDDVFLWHGTCSSATCMKDMLKQNRDCYSFAGERHDGRKIFSTQTGLTYEYSEEGTFLNQGGIAIGLGNNLQEATAVWNLVSQDLSSNVVSLALEYVEYNGNHDMFAYTKVSMDVKGTGQTARDIATTVFPLNVFSMGFQEYAQSKRTVNFALFLCYIFAGVLFACFLLRDFLVQLALTSISKPFYMFFTDFLQDDVWNALDVVTVILNVYILQDMLYYILLDGGLDLKKGFHSWTLDVAFSDSVTSDFVDPFEQFNRIARIQDTFNIMVGLNGLFLAIRVLKYFRSLSSLRLVLSSVVAALSEFLTLMLMIAVVLVAFVFMMYQRYGVNNHRYHSVFSTTNELFFFLVGSFDTKDLWDIDATFFFFVFMAYQVAFLLILNIFLSAITYRWKDVRRDADDFTIIGAFRMVMDSLKILRSTKQSGSAGDERVLRKLDEAYWQQRSVLRHVKNLNSNGTIHLGGSLYVAHQEGDDGDAEDAELAEVGMEQEHIGAFNFQNPEHVRRFHQTFQKAHMEIASQKCLELQDRDTGAGVEFHGKLQEAEFERTLEQTFDATDDAETMGIIEEDSQFHKAAADMTSHMDKKLQEHPRPAGEMSTVEEIWLDALVTVLEEAGALEHLQKLFVPMPMILPEKTQEWQIFNQKNQMERRLNRFFSLLQEEARVKHFEYLKDMARSKERVLKQQSLVLTDFLETLDSQIEKLQNEIRDLNKQSASMQSHVSPLL
eukprot:TRINITY_DN2266_c0_g1_i1.p1 TRINITY_DN2266_c0_g1~~TRINITY_DN2266_c0_g1_i1.p1  ORF type:complete len:1578 (-),score=299.86 TRINITY_DN2266_c0_g1_i1:42-4775(-)